MAENGATGDDEIPVDKKTSKTHAMMIYKKFLADDVDSDEEEEEGEGGILISKEDRKISDLLSMTAEEMFVFKKAWHVTFLGEESVPAEKLYDLFATLGYTMQESDIAWFEDTIKSDDGMYNCEVTMDAFNDWKQIQLNKEDLTAIYNMLAVDKKLLAKFPANRVGPKVKEEIGHEAMKNVLETFVDDAQITDYDVTKLMDEISSSRTRNISFMDLVTFFTRSS